MTRQFPCFNTLPHKRGFEGFGKGIKAKAITAMLKAKYKGGFNDSQIKWNFTKFLIDRSGQVVKRYEPTTEPEEIAGDIEKLL